MALDASAFIQVLPEPTYLVSSGGRVLAANKAAADLSCTSRSALVDAWLGDLLVSDQDRLRHYLFLCARSRQLVPGAFAWRIPGRDPLDIRCDGAVIQPANGASDATLFLRCRPRAEATDQFALLNQKIRALSTEILERKKAEQQRDALLVSERLARMQAERHSRMKDDFLANLSHELRTPLNAIAGWIQIVRRDTDGCSPRVKRAFDIIERNARAQNRLVEDLLDISQIITGKVRLDVQRVELAMVIEAAIEAARPAAEAKGIRIQYTLDPLAAAVKGDPNRLQQVVWNLVNNAVKFTPRGGRVQIFLERVNSHLEVVVSDTGEGIEPAFLPHVFERLRQQDASTTRANGGLGLGLAIVKELVELHGGTVRAKSPGHGQGSTFVVSLPLPAVHAASTEAVLREHPQAVPADPEPCELARIDGVRVLVVDDEPDGRDLVRALLEECGAVVTEACSAKDALASLVSHVPDVLVSDIGMPGMDGFELLREVRRLPDERAARTPAVALTAFARSIDRTRALLAGFQLHLSKPTDAAELVAAVASLSGRVAS